MSVNALDKHMVISEGHLAFAHFLQLAISFALFLGFLMCTIFTPQSGAISDYFAYRNSVNNAFLRLFYYVRTSRLINIRI